MFPFDLWHQKRVRPALPLVFLETILVTLLSTAMAWLVFPAAAGLVAVFLTCVGMQDSFAILLECNRRDIWEERLPPAKANAWLVTAIVCIFLGSTLAFSAVAWSLPADSMRALFGSQLQLSPMQAIDLSNLQFGFFDVLFSHNFWVFVLAVAVSMVFRSGGAMVILSWNASVWALTYAHLSRLTIAMGLASPLSTVIAVSIGVTPHLVLEAAAYITGTMAGIFVSKAIEKYEWRDPRFSRVILAALTLVAVGVGLLLVSVLIEMTWPAWWIHFVLPSGT